MRCLVVFGTTGATREEQKRRQCMAAFVRERNLLTRFGNCRSTLRLICDSHCGGLRLRDRRWPSLLWRQFNHHTASVLRIPAIHALSPPGVNRNSTSSNTATLFVTEKPNFSNSRMLASFFSPMRTTRLSFGTGSGDGEAGSVAYESIICRAAYATPRRRYAGSARMRKCKTTKSRDGDAKTSEGERHVPAVV